MSSVEIGSVRETFHFSHLWMVVTLTMMLFNVVRLFILSSLFRDLICRIDHCRTILFFAIVFIRCLTVARKDVVALTVRSTNTYKAVMCTMSRGCGFSSIHAVCVWCGDRGTKPLTSTLPMYRHFLTLFCGQRNNNNFELRYFSVCANVP